MFENRGPIPDLLRLKKLNLYLFFNENYILGSGPDLCFSGPVSLLTMSMPKDAGAMATNSDFAQKGGSQPGSGGVLGVL